MDECDCGWCGRCAKQLEWDRYLENTGGWHTPKGKEEDSSICGNGCGCDTRCMFPEG